MTTCTCTVHCASLFLRMENKLREDKKIIISFVLPNAACRMQICFQLPRESNFCRSNSNRSCACRLTYLTHK